MQIYTFENGHTTMFEHIKPDVAKTQRFTVVYTHGFCSDPWGRKPEEVKKWCVANGMGFFRYELAGHGSDKARFPETTINTYKAQLAEILTKIVETPVVMVGSSLGGWLSLMGACDFPDKVIGFIGLAAAPDFLKTYMEAFFKPEHKELLERQGYVEFPTKDFTYIITKEMIASGYENHTLDRASLPFKGKVRLLQGMKDASLLWKTALTIADKLESDDVRVVLLKNSTHRLNEDEDIVELRRALDDFIA